MLLTMILLLTAVGGDGGCDGNDDGDHDVDVNHLHSAH